MTRGDCLDHSSGHVIATGVDATPLAFAELREVVAFAA